MMVNPGHPSRGCWTCRTRRIKCDESYPTCSRCVKAKRVCLSYNNSRESICQPEVATQTLGYPPDMAFPALTDKPSIFTNHASHIGRFGLPERLPMPWNSYQFVALTTEVTTLGFHSLNSPLQTTRSRRCLHQKYGLAIYQLRKAVLSQPNEQILFVPILLFSLYEMVVSIGTQDKTWRIHLNALLVLLHQDSNSQNLEERNRAPLQNAVQFLSPPNIHENISLRPLPNLDKASFLLDQTTLVLRGLNNDFTKLIINNTSPPRTLDVQKLHRSIKEIHNNLSLIPKLLEIGSQEPAPPSTQNLHLTHKTLTLITSTILYQTTTFLQENLTTRTPKIPSLANLDGLIQACGEDICLIASTLYNPNHVSSSHPLSNINLLQTIHPLLAVSQLCTTTSSPNQAREMLWDIGVSGKIPVALGMVVRENDRVCIIGQVLDGLLLVGMVNRMG